MPYHDVLQAPAWHRFFEVCRTAAILTMATGSIAIAAATGEDARDMATVLPLLNDALESKRSGIEVPWSNAETARMGTIRIERTFYRGQQPCRAYTRTTAGSGAGYEVRGVGCRVGKLRWELEETRLDDPAASASAPAADPAAKSGGMPAGPHSPATSDASMRAGDPSGDTARPQPLRSPASPQSPALRYSLPTRSQL